MAESSFFSGNKGLNREYRNTMWARESDSSCEPPYHRLDHAEVKGHLRHARSSGDWTSESQAANVNVYSLSLLAKKPCYREITWGI